MILRFVIFVFLEHVPTLEMALREIGAIDVGSIDFLFLTIICLSFVVFTLVTIEPNLKKLALNQANMRMEEEAGAQRRVRDCTRGGDG